MQILKDGSEETAIAVYQVSYQVSDGIDGYHVGFPSRIFIHDDLMGNLGKSSKFIISTARVLKSEDLITGRRDAALQ